jgi:hypothetical protein
MKLILSLVAGVLAGVFIAASVSHMPMSQHPLLPGHSTSSREVWDFLVAAVVVATLSYGALSVLFPSRSRAAVRRGVARSRG